MLKSLFNTISCSGWIDEHVSHALLVFFAMLSAILVCFYTGFNDAITPVVFGIIAAALAEHEGGFYSRIKSLSTTLCCFALAASAVALLFESPLLFGIEIFGSSFLLVMLGAVSQRHAMITFATLLLSVYAMIGAESGMDLWHQIFLLLSGAACYGLLSLLRYQLWPDRAVKHHLSYVYEALAFYLESKSRLFGINCESDIEALRLCSAKKNVSVVHALNNAKPSLLRTGLCEKKGTEGVTNRLLNIYYIAQDIHERISSSHYSYRKLTTAFNRSDVMFRVQKLLSLQAESCRAITHLFKSGQDVSSCRKEQVREIEEIKQSLQHLMQTENDYDPLLLTQLGFLLKNLSVISDQLFAILDQQETAQFNSTELDNPEPGSLKEMWQRIKQQCTFQSPLLRHGLRIAIALTTGYGLTHLLSLQYGYWILLTVLFVCQPSYGSTWQRMTQRIPGTAAGLIIGIPLLYLFPGTEGQLVLMMFSGMFFFIFRNTRYGLSTCFITLFVLLCFSQTGSNYAVVLPRLADTLAGCVLSVLAVTFILPDWQAGRIREIMASAIMSNRNYLAEIIHQYETGKQDLVSYRLACRAAHNAEAQLCHTLDQMMAEPARHQMAVAESMRFLYLNHALLGYISTLGAHRTFVDVETDIQLFNRLHQDIDEYLLSLADQLPECSNKPIPLQATTNIKSYLHLHTGEQYAKKNLILQQFKLISDVLPRLHTQVNKLKQASQTGVS